MVKKHYDLTTGLDGTESLERRSEAQSVLSTLINEEYTPKRSIVRKFMSLDVFMDPIQEIEKSGSLAPNELYLGVAAVQTFKVLGIVGTTGYLASKFYELLF